jgi:hypothetical protein
MRLQDKLLQSLFNKWGQHITESVMYPASCHGNVEVPVPTAPVDGNRRQSDLPQLPGAPCGARKPGATKSPPRFGRWTEWCKYIVPENYVYSEVKEVINAQLFTNRRHLVQKFFFPISKILPSSALLVTTSRKLILINDKNRQYEKIILCNQPMLSYCRADILQCFLEK